MLRVEVDIDARYQKALRSVAGGRPSGYACPICTETFLARPKLWQHAKQVHQDLLEVSGVEDEAELKSQFLERARLQSSTNKDIPTTLKRSGLDEKGCEPNKVSTPSIRSGEPSLAEARHAEIFSSRPTVSRREYSAEKHDFIRSSYGMKNPLHDPDVGSPTLGRVRRHTKQNDFYSRGNNRTLREQQEETVAEPPIFGHPFMDDHHVYSKPLDMHPVPAEKLKGSDDEPEMLLQPETRPISHEQLVVEVKGIYAGLVMMEAKCVDMHERQSAAAQEKDPNKKVFLKTDQWQSLIALHKQSLQEHYDFFLASQHPSASPALSRLAAKYSMPARMWRHGIHAFLEVLRHRLPESSKHMLAFIYIAYTMMALLYETVSTFEDTWIECLGDLGRYRMAIEDDESKEREVWSSVARFWYNKVANKRPTMGRLHHHLAILARPKLYTRSLTGIMPFASARGRLMTLFSPILHGKDIIRRSSSLETLFIRAHGVLFTSQASDSADSVVNAVDDLQRDSLLDEYIAKVSSRFKETGVFAAVANVAALFEYGRPKQAGASKPSLRLAYEHARRVSEATSNPGPGRSLEMKDRVGVETLLTGGPSGSYKRCRAALIGISLKRTKDRNTKDRNVYPLAHIYLAFLWSLIIVQETCRYSEEGIVWRNIERDVPWTAVCSFLNELTTESRAVRDKIWASEFPRQDREKDRTLPEDFVLRGQVYTQWCFPSTWFTGAMVDDDERISDPPSLPWLRLERMQRISDIGQYIRFNQRYLHIADADLTAHFVSGGAATGDPNYERIRLAEDRTTSFSGSYDVQARPKIRKNGSRATVSDVNTLGGQHQLKHSEARKISPSPSPSKEPTTQDSDHPTVLDSSTNSQDGDLAKPWSTFATLSHMCHDILKKCTRLNKQLDSRSSGLRSARMLFIFNLIVPTTARSIPKNNGKAEVASSIAIAASSLTGLPYVAFIAGVLSVAFYIAAFRDPISVWGCTMSIWAFGWWAIKDDTTTTLWDCGTVFALWTISTFCYSQAAFRKYRIPSSTSLVIILGAAILDVATVSLITPTEASAAQSGLLLSLSLPSTTLTLAAIVNLLAAMQSYPDEQTYRLETGLPPRNHNIHWYAVHQQQHPPELPTELQRTPVELPASPSEGH